MAQPLARDVLRLLAEAHNLCVRPVTLRWVDKHTGQTEVFEVPCGARREVKCKPCAMRAKRAREQQIREGWHLTEEPTVTPEPASDEVRALVAMRCQFQLDRDEAARTNQWDQVADLDAGIAQLDEFLADAQIRGKLTEPAPRPGTDQAKPAGTRAVRSTKRRQDVPDLPRLKVDRRTVGRVYVDRDGRARQPSTFLTTTLGSFGPVHTAARTRRDGLKVCDCGAFHGQADPLLGTPLDPGGYDYRAAALAAIFFAPVMDRFWQNTRRAAGFDVQYAGTVEMQKRLAPHGHFAVRGTIPRALFRQIAAATYHQVWWPHFDTPVYTTAKPPVWDADREAYVDPTTGVPLRTWDEALDELNDPDATPAYVARLGSIHTRGIEAGTKDADKAIRYATKYLTKDLTDPAALTSDEQRAHFERLHQELSELPCSPTCANWLLYGVQPKTVNEKLTPGRCAGKVHQRETLGYTGRRVLISRKWSGKTLADHRADNLTALRAIVATVDPDAASTVGDEDQGADRDRNRFYVELARPNDPDVPPLQHRLMHAIARRERIKQQLRQAEQRAAAPPGPVSATPRAA